MISETQNLGPIRAVTRISDLPPERLGCFLMTSNVQFMTDLIAPETQLGMTGGRFNESQAHMRGRTSVSGWTCSQGVGSRVSGLDRLHHWKR